MNLKKFLVIDMVIMTIIAIGSEFIGYLISPIYLYISFAQAFLLLLVIRWRHWSLIPIVATAVARVLIYKAANFNEVVIYGLPILLIGLALLFMKLKFFKKINENKFTGPLLYTIIFTIFFISTGLLTKVLISNSYSFINELAKYSITYIIGMILMYLFAGQKTMFVDFIEVQKKNVKESEANGIWIKRKFTWHGWIN